MDVKSILFILLGVLLFASVIILASCGVKEKRLPHVSGSLFDLSDTVCLGLPRLEGSEKVLIYEGAGYVNNVVITYFRERYYCMWQDSEQDEDSPNTRVLYSTSLDGRHWEGPSVLAKPTDSTFVSPGGWINNGTSLSAILNYICSSDRSKGGTAWFMKTVDGKEWGDARPLLMSDGRRMAGILEQDPLRLPDGRTVGAAHLRPGLRVNPIYTDDPTGLTGWKEAAFPGGEGLPLEPSQYMAPDGRLVMFFRDQASSFLKLASVSDDRGESWSPPALTNIPDSRTKQCAGSLPDGRVFWVGNPTGNKSRRILALAISENGYRFDKAFLLAGPEELPTRRREGRYKTLGYNYPKAVVIGDELWIPLSQNKEDAIAFRIPLESL